MAVIRGHALYAATVSRAGNDTIPDDPVRAGDTVVIDPRHECWWTRQGRSDLVLDGEALRGAGVSMRVVTSAVCTPGEEWYSVRYGELGDNVLAVSGPVDEAVVHASAETWLGPLSSAAADLVPIREHRLTTALASALEIDLDAEDRFVEDRERIRRLVHFHDECLFRVEPVDRDLVDGIVRAALQQHAFFLGEDVDWSSVEPRVVNLLLENRRIELRSGTRGARLRVDAPGTPKALEI